MGVPPPMLAVPPPIVQPNGILQTGPAVQIPTQGFLQANHPQQQQQQQQQPPQQQQAILQQQQTILPQAMPIQLHQGNMVIQQQVQQQNNAIGNMNLPPPGVHIPIKAGSLVQLQGPPPPPHHLSHPPPNIQIQPQQPQTTQIFVNSAPPNYQYQYIQQTSQMQPTDPQGQRKISLVFYIYN